MYQLQNEVRCSKVMIQLSNFLQTVYNVSLFLNIENRLLGAFNEA